MTLLSIVLLAQLAGPYQHIPDKIAVPHTSFHQGQKLRPDDLGCGTMRTYVINPQDYHIERVLTCVPLNQQSLKNASAAHYQPVGDQRDSLPKLRY